VRSSPIFVFYTDEFWLNLHHFLYVLGRERNKARDAGRDAVKNAPADRDTGANRLSEKDRAGWEEALAWYAAGPSKKDLIFDDGLAAVTKSIAQAGADSTPKGVDPEFAAVLQKAAPGYRQAWWRRHQTANHAWVVATKALVQQHGAAVLRFITKAYQMEWPKDGYPVHVAAYANWAGAYSTTGNLLVVASLSEGNRGTSGLESVFHEGMHQWDDKIDAALGEQGRRIGKPVPGDLSHALIFFTAGEAVRSVVSGYIPFGETAGIWQRGLGRFKPILDEVWKPYLTGHGTRDEAFAEILRRIATTPASP
jgi:hypothetical protein